MLERQGFHLEPLNYHNLLNNPQFLQDNEDLWSGAVVPLNINWRVNHQMEVARKVSQYVLELADIPDHLAPEPTSIRE